MKKYKLNEDQIEATYVYLAAKSWADSRRHEAVVDMGQLKDLVYDELEEVAWMIAETAVSIHEKNRDA